MDKNTLYEKAENSLGEVYETLDDVKKVIRLIEEFPMNTQADEAFNFNYPDSSHGLFVVLEHACSLIDKSTENINSVRDELRTLEEN